jgi:hypothetical protein
MTELYIDRQQVILPRDFSLTVLEENPFFTKNGKYTYDLTLSLLEPVNTMIFKHYNRPNNNESIVTGRSARLIADSRIVLNGTEIILEITDAEVKVQLVSGESELNYFINSDQRINTLELGNVDDDPDYVPGIPETGELSNAKVLWIPVYSINEDRVINECDIWHHNEMLMHLRKFLPQPFLYHVVERIINAIGYSVKSNILATDVRFNVLYIVNGIHTKKYNKMLPDWTIKDFFSELEQLFNIVFLIDEELKEVDIIFKKNFYDTSKIISIPYVLDEFVQKIDKETRDDYSVANIGYALPDHEYFSFQNIETSILDRAEKRDHNNYTDIKSFIDNALDKDSIKNILFSSLVSNTQYICVEGIKNDPYELETHVYFPKKVNIFRPIMNNPDSGNLDMELKITPAPMVHVMIEIRSLRYDPQEQRPIVDVLFRPHTQMPAVQTSDYTLKEYLHGDLPVYYDQNGNFHIDYDDSNVYFDEEDVAFIDIQNAIEGNDDKHTVVTPNGIQLAFYAGMGSISEDSFDPYFDPVDYVSYPLPFVDYIRDFVRDAEVFINPALTLRLDDEEGLNSLYTQSAKIDTTRDFLFKFLSPRDQDSKSIFIIKNKKFVCKELRYTLSANGYDKIIEGFFYPMD